MKRKMTGAAAAYMSGLFFASFFKFGFVLFLAALLAVVLISTAKRLGITKGDIAMIGVFFTAAACVYSVYTDRVYGRTLTYAETSGCFCGEIISADYYDEELASYVLDGSINGEFNIKAVYFGDAVDASIGDSLSIASCTFSVPDSDYLFDSASYNMADGIFLSIENAEGVTLSVNNSRRVKNLLIDYKERIKSEFVIKTGEQCGGFLAGMVFGDKDNISDSTKTSMYRSGIGHVMAVSGLHVSIIAALLMFILKQMRINRYLSFLLMNLAAAVIILMAEAPVSALRAAIMIDFIYSAELLRRQSDTLNSLACAVLLLCISNPYVIHSCGFMLSVSGTFGIGVFAPYLTKNIGSSGILSGLFKSILQMMCVSVCIMPVSVIYFYEVSLISPITNVLLIPLCTVVLVIGIIYTFTGGAVSLLSLASLMIKLILFAADRLSRNGLTYLSCGDNKLIYIAIICSVFVMFGYLLFKSRRLTAFAAAAAFTVFVFSTSLTQRIKKDKFTIAVLGRGTNTVVAVQYKGRADVIDLSGHYRSPDYLDKYLIANGISKVSFLALTNDVQAQYSAYCYALELVDIENLLVYGGTKPSEECVLFSSEGFTAQNSEYTITYSDRVLTVEYADIKTEFLPAAMYTDSSADLSVAYGNITKSTVIDIYGRTLYLDESESVTDDYSGINNFEIEISEDGRITLRRL